MRIIVHSYAESSMLVYGDFETFWGIIYWQASKGLFLLSADPQDHDGATGPILTAGR